MKSIYETTCGRCGTHWIKYIISDTLGLDIELPDVKIFSTPMGRLRGYIDKIAEKESRISGGNIYTYHAPMNTIKRIHKFVNIICIVRDPRDIIVSSAYYAIKNGNIDIRDFKSYMSSKIRAKNTFATKIMASYLRCNEYVMRYEDLVNDTFFYLSKMLRHFGYEYDESDLVSSIEKRSFFNMSGGRNVGEEDISNHFRKGIVGDWKNHFSEEDNKIFVENHKSVMKGFGYVCNY